MADVSLARTANIFRAQENELFLQTRLKNYVEQKRYKIENIAIIMSCTMAINITSQIKQQAYSQSNKNTGKNKNY